MQNKNRNTKDTSWNQVAKWYNKTVEDKESYQKTVLLPGVLRMLNLKKEERVLDSACGNGFFTEQMSRYAREVVGVELSRELVAIAKKQHASKNISYSIGDAQKLTVPSQTFDVVTIIMALQNIENADAAVREASKALKKGGRLLVVINHPILRTPRQTSWGWDEEKKTQYRRIDRYMTELKIPIEMHPGRSSGERTWSFHRPLFAYIQMLSRHGLYIADMEEWISTRESESGPRKKGENRAKAEIPLFMAILAKKLTP